MPSLTLDLLSSLPQYRARCTQSSNGVSSFPSIATSQQSLATERWVSKVLPALRSYTDCTRINRCHKCTSVGWVHMHSVEFLPCPHLWGDQVLQQFCSAVWKDSTESLHSPPKSSKIILFGSLENVFIPLKINGLKGV